MTGKEKLTGFLYVLLRDHLPAGRVEEIVSSHIENPVALGTEHFQFSNKPLAEYAKELAERILEE